MAKHVLVVLSNAASEEREQEFNDWYTREAHGVVKIPWLHGGDPMCGITGADGPEAAVMEIPCHLRDRDR